MNLLSDSWDRARALDGVGGDEQFLRELAGIFLAACPTLLKNLEDSITYRDFSSAADTAHLLGHAARNLAATRVTDAALAVEAMAYRGEFDNIDAAFHVLRQEAGKLLDALTEFRRGQSGPLG